MYFECEGCGKLFKRVEMHIGGCKAYQNLQKYRAELSQLKSHNTWLETENKNLLDRVNVTYNTHYHITKIYFDEIDRFTSDTIRMIKEISPKYQDKNRLITDVKEYLKNDKSNQFMFKLK